jgi:hypothetical protein
VSSIERLFDLLSAQYPWGLHSFKLLLALLVPVVIVWVADWRLRALSDTISRPEADSADAAHAAAVTTSP